MDMPTWFVERFGSRPTDRSVFDMGLEVVALEDKLARLKALIKATQEWEASRYAAMLTAQAWQEHKIDY